MATPPKDRITCHVLDTTTGRPGRGIRVRLLCQSPLSSPSPSGYLPSFEAHTDDDGRVRTWTSTDRSSSSFSPSSSSSPSAAAAAALTVDDILARALADKSLWTLTFAAAPYFAAQGKDTFFPDIVVTFTVDRREQHCHVPLLLSQYSYTTYRGS